MRPWPRPITLVSVILVAAAFLGLLVAALTSALVYDISPSELASHAGDASVRLYGLVVPGSERWDAATRTLSFAITDGATTVAVSTSDLPTDLFRDGMAVVLAGHAAGPGQFTADQVLVKHSEVYQALGPGQTIPPGVVEQLVNGSP